MNRKSIQPCSDGVTHSSTLQQLGDELCCWVADCWNRGLPELASKLRALLGENAVLYANECTPRLQHTGNASWESVQVPADLDLISVDIYGGPAYGGGRDEVSEVRQQYEHGLLPKLHSGQQALLVPGLFVSNERLPAVSLAWWHTVSL